MLTRAYVRILICFMFAWIGPVSHCAFFTFIIVRDICFSRVLYVNVCAICHRGNAVAVRPVNATSEPYEFHVNYFRFRGVCRIIEFNAETNPASSRTAVGANLADRCDVPLTEGIVLGQHCSWASIRPTTSGPHLHEPS